MEGCALLRRFVFAFAAFVGIVVPAAFALALPAAPAIPAAPLENLGCERNLVEAKAGLAALQARVKSLGPSRDPEICNASRLYFLEVMKARAVTAICKTGPDRERELGRLDADVEHINEAIGDRCS